MSRKKWKLLCAALLVSAVTAEEVQKDEGVALFQEQCIACHLTTGHGNVDLKAPSIAGLERWYVAYQLRRFRDGIRGTHVKDESGKLMQHVAEQLNERQIAFLSRHVASLPRNPKRKTLDGGDAAEGKAIFAEKCMACHRYNASGERAFLSAPLVCQQDWYLLAQLQKFQKHERGSVEGDELGPKMHLVTSSLDLEKEVPHILAFLTSLPTPAEEDAEAKDKK